MPKRIADGIKQEVQRRVAAAHRRGEKLTLEQLHRELNPGGERQYIVGRTTVYKLLKVARDEIKDVEPDRPWNPSPTKWNPEAYPLLLALDRYCLAGVEDRSNDTFGRTVSKPLSNGEAEWGQRLYGVCKEAPVEISFFLVTTFADRETTGKGYGQSMSISDLVGFMEYRPWESEAAEKTYRAACKLGRIPMLGAPLEESGDAVLPPGMERIDSVEIEGTSLAPEQLRSILEEGLEPSQVEERRELEAIMERLRLIHTSALERFHSITDSTWENEEG